ncbi:MAG: NAD+ synthase, partial [Gammaproteobacteria bacterium]|nr:NAD+ synthase [Gammaproteobacteria bacterium]
QVVVNLNASPFHIGRDDERLAVVAERARGSRVPIIYAHMVGGQDELVFDGASFVVNRDGTLTQRARHFDEDLMVCTLRLNPEPTPLAGDIESLASVEQGVYQALTTGVRDYVGKNGFKGVVIGLSGGVDSALTLVIAVDALGADAVQAVLMPSRYTSAMSIEDARSQAEVLGVIHHQISIEPMFAAYLEQLAPVFGEAAPDATEENLQARCRGMLLMAISNKSGSMVLTTGNKSEMAVGYATLYGDMAGGFAAIKDVSKTLVYRLARYRNAVSPVIPERVLTRPPSAELAHDQKDEDTLPPYDVLDPILEMYIEQDRSPEEIVACGFASDIVYRVAQLVDRNEYKRRQAAPGVRITGRAFGRDRRYPITSGFKNRPGSQTGA